MQHLSKSNSGARRPRGLSAIVAGVREIMSPAEARHQSLWRPSGSRLQPPVVLATGYFLLLIAWAFANPPFASPDEKDHYVRAVGLAGGELLGVRAPIAIPPQASEEARRFYRLQNEDIRAVVVPGGLFARGVTCNAFRPDVSASCLERARIVRLQTRQRTLVGNYEPLGYVLPGLAARHGGDPFWALRFGRLAAAVTCFGFLCLALLAIWDREAGALSLIGLIAAITPMAVFVCASLNPNGLEIASGTAFLSSLLRLTRSKDAPQWVWAAAPASGAVLALSRSLGWLWVALDIAVVVALYGTGTTRRIVRARKRHAFAAAAGLVAAVSGALAWSVAYAPGVSVDAGLFVRLLEPSLRVVPKHLSEIVGRFGWLDASMPKPSIIAWYGIILALLVTALSVADRRARLVLAATVAGGLAVLIFFSAWYQALSGIGDVQGRHVLPVVVAVPLVSGELLLRNRRALGARASRIVAGTAAIAATDHVIAWYSSARRQSIGADGLVFFLRAPEWSPPVGWWEWLIVVVLGGLLIAIVGIPRGQEPPSEAKLADWNR